MDIYIVGGAVRDGLLGLPVQDRDFVVVGATPEQMLAAGYRPVGKDFPVFLHPTSHAGRQAATGPEGRACQIKEQEVAPGKAQGAGQGRGQGGKPGDEFGDHQGGDTAPGKTDFALAHAAVRGNGDPAEEAEDGPPPAPAGAEPDTVCCQGGQGGQNQGLNREYPVCHPLGSGQQQDGQGWQGRPRLLDEHPKKDHRQGMLVKEGEEGVHGRGLSGKVRGGG